MTRLFKSFTAAAFAAALLSVAAGPASAQTASSTNNVTAARPGETVSKPRAHRTGKHHARRARSHQPARTAS